MKGGGQLQLIVRRHLSRHAGYGKQLGQRRRGLIAERCCDGLRPAENGAGERCPAQDFRQSPRTSTAAPTYRRSHTGDHADHDQRRWLGGAYCCTVDLELWRGAEVAPVCSRTGGKGVTAKGRPRARRVGIRTCGKPTGIRAVCGADEPVFGIGSECEGRTWGERIRS